MFDYWNLKGRIREKWQTQEAFAKTMGMSLTALNQRLNGVVDWKMTEVAKACEHLDIQPSDAWIYFFKPKV